MRPIDECVDDIKDFLLANMAIVMPEIEKIKGGKVHMLVCVVHLNRDTSSEGMQAVGSFGHYPEGLRIIAGMLEKQADNMGASNDTLSH